MKDSIESFLLTEAETDLVDFSFVVSYAADDLGLEEADLREAVLGAIRDVLRAGQVQVGDLEDRYGPPLRVRPWEIDTDSAGNLRWNSHAATGHVHNARAPGVDAG